MLLMSQGIFCHFINLISFIIEVKIEGTIVSIEKNAFLRRFLEKCSLLLEFLVLPGVSQ